jgi:hypothetical protein
VSSTTQELQAEVERLRAAIIKHRSQKADDRCIEDDDELYAALGDGIPCDRRVGDKIAMLHNCARFIERRCEGGGWPSYVELEAERDEARETIRAAHDLLDTYGIKREDEQQQGGGGIWLVTEYALPDRIRFAMEVPGELYCPTCCCRIHKRFLSAIDGSVGTDARPVEEPCPNGCGLMRQLTWAQADAEERLANAHLLGKYERLRTVIEEAREKIASIVYSLDNHPTDDDIGEAQMELGSINAALKELLR